MRAFQLLLLAAGCYFIVKALVGILVEVTAEDACWVYEPDAEVVYIDREWDKRFVFKLGPATCPVCQTPTTMDNRLIVCVGCGWKKDTYVNELCGCCLDCIGCDELHGGETWRT